MLGINAVAESFFPHLKPQMHHHHDFTSRMMARTAIMAYIQSCYSRRRAHANNQGLPPARALAEYQSQTEKVRLATRNSLSPT